MDKEMELAAAIESRMKLLEEKKNPGAPNETSDGSAPAASAEVPPSRLKTADEVIAEMKKVPLFMTSMDELDEDNEQIQALKAIAYEGTRAEIAQNFRNQGNECVKFKQYSDAREFYSKAIQALKGPIQPQEPEDDDELPEQRVVEIDEEAEEKKERSIEEACYANRALCNLEMKNYRSCQSDCARALRLNVRNVKAWYRAATACLAIDKIPEALEASQCGLRFDPANTALKTLLSKVEKRKQHLEETEARRKEREEQAKRKDVTLKVALKARNIATRTTKDAPDMEDAAISLADPLDPKSAVTFPVTFLYPLHAQSDFVKAFTEDETLSQHLEYILPVPWDQEHEYTLADVECYMDTVTGGLIKAGKNLPLLKLLGSGKVEVVDGLVKVSVVPKAKASAFIEEFKKRKGKQ
ncbi:TPR-like protein [Hortaea werneckii]|nr:TPR-like protein [Hortaea werneckii]KAI7109249.1 TPR-like protein [Hortaea werneckii]KAI7243661.1 TPR-like protein [Hortaea werneckii]KAI7323573.1 TPR-like protein [Hortaea werneckii]KAI7376130.1 TPR-like protein [Hortaea werneckii]